MRNWRPLNLIEFGDFGLPYSRALSFCILKNKLSRNRYRVSRTLNGVTSFSISLT